ncbi:hypothetical protein HPB49_020737 [Dermacentor silvarum]|uniref:Uncharacterized protein n=1 Tax=Dermacentor silvarum TaxID=543639 RepID=A0ACB8D7T8_DERSI|nr:hypothetical protein HPB49_020737 [Dermacentor silvarum]
MEVDASPWQPQEASTDCADDWLAVKRRKQRSKEAPKNSDPPPEAQQRSPRRPPPLPKQRLKVILRPREGLVFWKWPTPVIARAVPTAGGYPRTTPTQNLIVRIESKQNITAVSTSSEDMVATIRDISTVHLGAKEYAVATYIAPPANSTDGMAHGIPQGTTDAELMRGLYAHKRKILQARMLGPCATALIIFEGRTVPRATLVAQAAQGTDTQRQDHDGTTKQGSPTAIVISDPLLVHTQGDIATTRRQQIQVRQQKQVRQ